jgi:hypothetical protein
LGAAEAVRRGQRGADRLLETCTAAVTNTFGL